MEYASVCLCVCNEHDNVCGRGGEEDVDRLPLRRNRKWNEAETWIAETESEKWVLRTNKTQRTFKKIMHRAWLGFNWEGWRRGKDCP